MVDKEVKKDILISRKYKLRLGTVKLAVFRLFEEGYKPSDIMHRILWGTGRTYIYEDTNLKGGLISEDRPPTVIIEEWER